MVIIINPTAGGAKALQKWEKIESVVSGGYGKVSSFVLNGNGSLTDFIDAKLNEGHTKFIAAGGDGTVNLLLQNLLEHCTDSSLSEIKLGAIGLGSTNAFHTLSGNNRLNGIPVKIDFNTAAFRDVGILRFLDEDKNRHKRYWLNCANIGIQAQATQLLNSAKGMLQFLKRNFPITARFYISFYTAASFRNQEMKIRFGNEAAKRIAVGNLKITQSCPVPGIADYKSVDQANAGFLSAQLDQDVTSISRIAALQKLYISNQSQRRFKVKRLSIQSEKPFAVEFDGEIIKTQQVIFSIQKKMIQVCRQ